MTASTRPGPLVLNRDAFVNGQSYRSATARGSLLRSPFVERDPRLIEFPTKGARLVDALSARESVTHALSFGEAKTSVRSIADLTPPSVGSWGIGAPRGRIGSRTQIVLPAAFWSPENLARHGASRTGVDSPSNPHLGRSGRGPIPEGR